MFFSGSPSQCLRWQRNYSLLLTNVRLFSQAIFHPEPPILLADFFQVCIAVQDSLAKFCFLISLLWQVFRCPSLSEGFPWSILLSLFYLLLLILFQCLLPGRPKWHSWTSLYTHYVPLMSLLVSCCVSIAKPFLFSGSF